ncbi:adenosine receptor A3-like [Actinia tenebrosa]|uniref:Adenosine receptor A3-like n=1 Tax=Actinia tenebrosa TaxID=6105 RepID=A0A6P8J4A9_ACTTE|nr:adenosine receptor A3-like [Actinia tenebrosa]
MVFNALVIVSIWTTPSLHKPSYVLIANLAITDFIVGAVADPSMFVVNLAALEDWESVFCFSSFVGRGGGYWMGAMSLYTLTAISVDRLLAIKLKSRYKTIVTLKKVVINLIFCWIGTCCLLTLFKLSITMVTIILSTYLFLLLGTLTTCYAMAYYSLKRMMSPVSPNTTRDTLPGNASFHAQKYRRTLNTTLLVFFTVILFYFPYLCSLVTTAIIYKVVPNASQSGFRDFLYRFITSSELVVFVNSTMNPFLYLWRMKDLSRAAKETLKRIFGCKRTVGEKTLANRSVQQS